LPSTDTSHLVRIHRDCGAEAGRLEAVHTDGLVRVIDDIAERVASDARGRRSSGCPPSRPALF
jgi:hypothetical protein